ncbi:thiamine diphosphokinase [Bombilactobacillus folatiphilus]|uniref:Thiamine diphosphokinase n=1 Tax=Bombilactobacillus folatiphilus TaxID=2923362 RepID=A0ABY4P7D3_9LACO|nr:thiamine diphosphokinase [Bombilactobacillus folatiphilus]UQS81613.1 thiamine diphosphokinase [Bombilactobacillus folatiphilus]
MNKVNIMLGSSQNLPCSLNQISGTWIGADHGNITLLQNEILPQISVGDFDSLSSVELAWLEASVSDIRYAKPEKDFTDSQAAVFIALEDLAAQQVDIYGATGGRLDHEMVNVLLPLDVNVVDLPKIRLIDSQNVITYYHPGSYSITKLEQTKYLCFLNLVAVKALTIQGAKYPLAPTDFERPVSLSSNEFIGDQPVYFSFKSGTVAVIQCSDLI